MRLHQLNALMYISLMYLTNVVKSSWRLGIYYFNVLPCFLEEAPFYCQLGRGRPILLAIRKWRSHFIGNWERGRRHFMEWILEEGSGVSFYMSNLQCWLELHFMVHALLWGLILSKSTYFSSAALLGCDLFGLAILMIFALSKPHSYVTKSNNIPISFYRSCRDGAECWDKTNRDITVCYR